MRAEVHGKISKTKEKQIEYEEERRVDGEDDKTGHKSTY